jgi:glycerol-3-phosphate acyltransferase PlsY
MVVAATALPERADLLVFLVLLALFIAWTHRSNIARMRRREETRMGGLMILRRPR